MACPPGSVEGSPSLDSPSPLPHRGVEEVQYQRPTLYGGGTPALPLVPRGFLCLLKTSFQYVLSLRLGADLAKLEPKSDILTLSSVPVILNNKILTVKVRNHYKKVQRCTQRQSNPI